MNAVHLCSVITLGHQKPRFSFKALTALTSQPGDFSPHVITVQLERFDGFIAAYTQPMQFTYGYAIDVTGLGGFYHTTNFDLDMAVHAQGNYT